MRVASIKADKFRWRATRSGNEKGNRLTSLVLTVRETLRYRGAIGQWSWVLHRLTGVGVVLFLALHVIDTSWAVFIPISMSKRSPPINRRCSQ